MATLDDKLLGEKLHYYCSSSEDEGGNDSDDETVDKGPVHGPAPPPPVAPPSGGGGGSANTGPKGVLKDWRRFKQLETEKRQEAEMEKMELAKKLSLTCRTDKEDEKANKKDADLDAELEALLEDDFLETYMARRMQEMMETTQNNVKRFGQVVELRSGEAFLNHVDDEDKRVTVIVLIHEPSVIGCEAMLGCIACLAPEHPRVKFCSILSTAAGLSRHFKVSGVPALLVYKAGQLCGSWVRLTDQLGEDFYSADLEQFLVEHGMLQDKDDVPKVVRGPAINCQDDDSD